MENIKIENFAGIKSIDFDFKSINILIGPQGSGKSITVKLLYFFKSFFGEIIGSIDSDESKRELDKKQKDKFVTFFPKESWPKGNFKITYTLDKTTITIERVNNQLNFNYSDNLKKVISKARKLFLDEKKRISEDPKRSSYSFKRQLNEKLENIFRQDISPDCMNSQFFIPAGRSFFANIQKGIFSFLSDNRSLDPFLIEFGSFYENLKRFYNRDGNMEKVDKDFDEIISQILNSKYLREKDKDFLVHSDNRKVNLSNASSGQQETLPLVVILRVLNELRLSVGNGATIYIEEPEAHLFPIAQKAMVKLLARTFNNKKSRFQIIVTTHSPYILASFNNLIQAGRLVELKPSEEHRIVEFVPKQEHIAPDLLTAYSLNAGEKVVLIEEESKLIAQTILDSVSNEIAVEFDKLLDIEF
jgi:ABC-type phosphate transport system ATPase subunit